MRDGCYNQTETAEKWGRLTDDDWKVVGGKRDQLVGKIQEHYGLPEKKLSVS